MFLPHGSESFIEGEEERCAAPDDVEIFNLLSLESDTKDKIHRETKADMVTLSRC